MGIVIVLSVFLIGSVVTIVNSVDLTVTTIYNYTKVTSPIIPQHSGLKIDPADRTIVASEPGIDRIIESSGFFLNINTVFGKAPFICFGVGDAERDYLMRRAGDKLAAGRMPFPGAAEAVLSEGLVRNKHLKIGDEVAGPADKGGISGVPVAVHLVGVLSGPTWMAFTSRQFADEALPFLPRFELITARSPATLSAVSTDLDKKLDSSRVQVLSYQSLIDDLRTSLTSMYLIMGMVNAMVILVVSIMSGMLSNIYFTQRIAEFAILSAIGMRRSVQLLHAVSETAIVTAVGWFFGIAVTWLVLGFLRGRVFEPRGMLINPRDTMALLYTVPIPIMITAFALVTIAYRLSRLDPVTIIERR